MAEQIDIPQLLRDLDNLTKDAEAMGHCGKFIESCLNHSSETITTLQQRNEALESQVHVLRKALVTLLQVEGIASAALEEAAQLLTNQGGEG